MDLVLLYIPGFMLTFLRLSAAIVSMLMLGTTMDSKWARLVIALGLSFIIFGRAPQVVEYHDSLPTLGFLAIREIGLGLAMGFSFQLVVMTLKLAGTLIGHEMGFSLSQVMDPNTGIPSPVIGRFFETLSFLLLLSVDGHHKIFKILANSFDRIPVGMPWSIDALKDGLILLTVQSFHTSIRLASPIYATLIIITTTLLVLSRAVPQVHLMDFAYALRIIFALVAMLWFMTVAGPYIFDMFGTFFDGIDKLVFELGRA